MAQSWTDIEDQYLQGHWQTMSDAEMAEVLGRSILSITTRRHDLHLSVKRTWTPEEVNFLCDNWGSKSINAIAEKLGRTVHAIKIKAFKLNLGPVLMAGDYVSLNQLLIAVTGTASTYSYKIESWVKQRGLPVHTRRVSKNSWRVVYLDEFWAWAEKNRSFIDFSKMEPLTLGKEPAWVAQQRKIDTVAFANQRKDPWTPEEDQRLAYLLGQHKYTWAEISKELQRSNGSIQHRCLDLGLKERPVRESPHNPWSAEDLEVMANMIRQGCSYAMIGAACSGRSEKAVRGRCFQTYHTENLDKVRAMLGAGPWGTGAPEPSVKSEKHKTSVQKPMTRLCELLLIRRNSMEWGEFWQKDLCQHWSAVQGCLMRCSDCDSCTRFQRIRPQYCRMCGGEFLERTQQTFCPKCRAMRKKQAQRKYAVLHARGRI